MKSGGYVAYLFVGFLPLGILNLEASSWLSEDDKNEVLREFRNLAIKIVPEEFMKQDEYLNRWLIECHFDVEKAFEKLQIAIEWRNQNNISSIIYETFPTTMHQDFQVIIDGTVDKLGRPLFQAFIGRINLRKVTIAGQQSTFIYLYTQMLEIAERLIYYTRTIENPNSNVTQTVIIGDLQGFNLITTGCWKCMSVLPQIVPVMDTYYPGLVHKIIFINTPRVFNTMMNVMKSIMSESTKKALAVYGSDKQIWSEALMKEISPDQLADIYGGLLPSKGRSTEPTRHKVIKYVEEENQALAKRKHLQLQATTHQDHQNAIKVHYNKGFSGIHGNHKPHHHYSEQSHNTRHSAHNHNTLTQESGKHNQINTENDTSDSSSSTIQSTFIKKVENPPHGVANTAIRSKFYTSFSHGLMMLQGVIVSRILCS